MQQCNNHRKTLEGLGNMCTCESVVHYRPMIFIWMGTLHNISIKPYWAKITKLEQKKRGVDWNSGVNPSLPHYTKFLGCAAGGKKKHLLKHKLRCNFGSLNPKWQPEALLSALNIPLHLCAAWVRICHLWPLDDRKETLFSGVIRR